ncbi:MAG TPA: helix-turn-helix domain-containing protein [Gemmatimonadales bacterium]
MRRKPEEARATILAATERLLRKRGTGTPTLDAVAREARCAKGLVNYHFPSKAALLAAIAEAMGRERTRRWQSTLGGSSPEVAIRATWDLVLAECRDGTSSAWAALRAERDRTTVQTVSSQVAGFGRSLATSLATMLSALELKANVPVSELGWYLAAVVHGMELMVDAGADPGELQGAYAAAWLGILSVTGPA